MRRKQQTQLKNPPLTKSQLLHNQLSAIQQKIITKLLTNQLTITKPQIPFLNQHHKKQQQLKQHAKIINNKKLIINQLKFLQLQDKQYTARRRITSRNQKHQRPQRSQFNQQDKKMLMILRNKMLNYEKSLDKKYKQREQIKIKLLKQQSQNKVKQRKQSNKKKKKQIQQKLSHLKERAIERQAIKKSTDIALKQAQQKKHLYSILNQQWQNKHRQEQKIQHEIIDQQNKQKYINFISLKQHSKKYQQIIKQKKIQLQQKRLCFSRLSSNSNPSFYTSKFYTVLMQQQKNKKQQEQQKRQNKKILKQKKIKYSQDILKQHQSKIKNKPIDQISDIQQQHIVNKLTDQQIKKLGNLYLVQGNKRIKKQTQNDQPIQNTLLNKSLDIPRHHDYLTQTRINKQKQNKLNYLSLNPQKQTLKIVNNYHFSQSDKIYKLKLLATKFDKSKIDIITKIQGKLQILKAMN